MVNNPDSFDSPVEALLASASSRGDRLRALTSFSASATASAADSEEVDGLEASFTAGMGGLGRSGSGRSGSVAITHGECVVVVHEDVDNSSDCTLCGVEIGQTGKLCFKEGCSTNSHVQARGESSFWLKQGIYIRSGATGAASKKVHSSPIGSLDIFNIHHEEIVGISDTTPALWTARFNTWEQASDPEQAAAMFAVKAQAKRLQTPAKPRENRPDYSSYFQSMAPSELLGDSLEDRMKMYESLWRKTSEDRDDAPLPEGFELGEYLVDNHRKLGQISEFMIAIAEDHQIDKRWTEGELHGSALRITDLEKIVGEPVGDAASVWTSISTLSSGIRHAEDKITNTLNTKVASIESELDAMLDAMEVLKAGLKLETSDIGRRMDSFVAQQDNGSAAVAVEEMIRTLAVEKESAQRRLDSIEARMEVDNAKIEIGNPGKGGSVLRSALDLRAYLKGVDGGDLLSFGGFADVYTYLSRIQSRQDNISMEAMVKAHKDVKSLDISLAEACVVHTHTHLIPPIFGVGSDSPTGAALTLLPTYKSWRDLGRFTGIAHTIESSMSQVGKEINEIIMEDFSEYPQLYELRSLAIRVSLQSQSFIISLIRWVDETYQHLTAAGNEEMSVWWVITTVIKQIFKEYLAPARSTPTDITYEDGVHRASAFVWGTLKTDVASSRMSDKGIRNHPTVVGSYAQWLVSNNGLKDALAAKNDVKRLQGLIDTLKSSLADQVRSVTDLKSKVETVKKVADKAFNKANGT